MKEIGVRLDLFAILHKPSGKLFRIVHGGRSYTFADAPYEKGAPRLFNRKSDATMAMNCWLRGFYCLDSGFRYVPGRKPEDVEVVKITLMARRIEEA